MRVTFTGAPGRGVGAKDLILGLIAQETSAGATHHVVEYDGEAIRALSMEGRMTVSNMSIEWGARAGLIAPDETTYRYLEGRPGVQEPFERAVERWSHYVSDERRRVRPRARRRRRRAGAAAHLGHEPRPDGADHRRRADAGQRGRAARARLHGSHGRRAARGHARRSRLHRLVHERPPGRPARGRRGRARQARREQRAGAGRAGLDAGQGRGRGRGPRSRLLRGGLRVAQRRLLDVPRHEPGRRRARRSAWPRPPTATSRAVRAASRGRT